MDTNKLITMIREQIETLGKKCYSPDIPYNDEVCSAIQLGQGENQRALNKNILYSEIPFYILIRGTTNDKETRTIADNIFNLLDMSSIISDTIKITLIRCNTPNYAFRDENQRIYYNINCNLRVDWSED